MITTDRPAWADNGLRNYLRRIPPSGVLYLPGLDNGSWYSNTILDYSGYANNGTNNGATYFRLPSGVWYLNFDGDDLVTFGNPVSLRITNNITIEFWCKLNASGATWAGLASKYSNAGVQNAYGVFKTATDDFANFRISKDGGTATGTTLTSNVAIPSTTWQHIRCTYQFVGDGSSLINIYQNDVNTGTSNVAAGPIFAGTDVLDIGRYSGAVNFLNGKTAFPRVINAISSSHFSQERALFGV